MIYLFSAQEVMPSCERFGATDLCKLKERIATLKCVWGHELKIIVVKTIPQKPLVYHGLTLWRSFDKFLPEPLRAPRQQVPDIEATNEARNILGICPGVSEVWIAMDGMLVIVTRRSMRSVCAPSLTMGDRGLKGLLDLVLVRHGDRMPCLIGTTWTEAKACAASGVEFIPLPIWNAIIDFSDVL
jgi:hypothetical protein